MPDWQRLVRDRLSQLELDPAEKAEVCAELAAHLEDDYLFALEQGISEQAAILRAREKLNDWRELQAQVELTRSKESVMNKRVSQFWFPAFLTLLLAMVWLMVIQLVGPRPWVVTASSKSPRVVPVLLVYVSWLMALPFIGALGAYLSIRAGGRPRAVWASVIFPILPYFAFFVVGLPLVVILDDHAAHNIMISALFIGLAAWVILPAIALLAGGLPVRYFYGRLARAGSPDVADR